MARVGVIGLGNVLMGDDAFGPHVVKLLDARYELPPNVAVVELGTPGADLAVYLDGLDTAVVVDAVRAGGEPGQVRLMEKEQLLSGKPLVPASPHEPGLREALFALELRGRAPRRVQLVGVVPDAIVMRVGLSPAVCAAIPAALGELVTQLRRLGVRVTERTPPRAPELWWERA